MILLDTCVLIWLTGDLKKLSPQALDLLENTKFLFVSSITAFEISLSVKKKRLELPLFSQNWFDETLDYFRIEEIPVTSKIYLKSVDLPPFHQDPADRILIATALERSLTLLSPDSHIQKYPEVRCAW